MSIKVHAVIHANDGVTCDVKYTSTTTHDSVMLAPSRFSGGGDILAIDRAYIDYAKFEKLTNNSIVYITNMDVEAIVEIYRKRWK